jgi:acetyl esterase/lipase
VPWTPRTNRFAWTCYLGHPPGAAEPPPYAAPARRRDLSGLPSAWIGVGDLDLFHDEVVDYARRLRGAGAECGLLVEPGLYHAGGLDHADSAPQLERLRTAAKAALRSALAPTTHRSATGHIGR